MSPIPPPLRLIEWAIAAHRAGQDPGPAAQARAEGYRDLVRQGTAQVAAEAAARRERLRREMGGDGH